MDNKKIGNLIAELRKKQGLTQQELGDKVGVGFKAVSKWERGVTLPDITIINEVSKILGITSDELLAGELKVPEEPDKTEVEEENIKEKKKISPKLIITISIITVFFIFFASILIYQNNKTYTYNLVSVDESEYYVAGKLYFNKENTSIIINKLNFKNEDLKAIIIKNYEYSITSNNKFLFGYGYIDTTEFIEEPISIRGFTETFKADILIKTKTTNKEIIENDIILQFKFLTSENEIITKDLYITLEPIE